MKITAVNMRLVEREKVKAFASITIDDEFVVHDLRIVQGEKGLFVAMPSRKLPNGEFRDVAHPIKSEVREMIQKTVLEEFGRQREAAPAETMAPTPAPTEAPLEEAGTPEEQATTPPTEEAPAEEAPAAEEEPEEVSEEKAREGVTEESEKPQEPQQ